MKRVIGAAVLGGMLLVGAGCGKAADKAAERISEEAIEEGIDGSNVDIDDDGNVDIETEDGSISTGTDLPDDWPEDVPVMEGAVVQGSYSSSSNGETIHTASFSTDRSVDEVLDFYKDELADWTVDTDQTGDFNGTASGTLVLSKGDRGVTVSATDGDDGKVTMTMAVTTPDA